MRMGTWAKGLASLLVLAGLAFPASAREREVGDGAPPWFKDAKFGIFIHWGIFSAGPGGASWPIFNERVSYDEYMAQAKGFSAENYDPAGWAKLFRESGARYAVLTTKHHDGMALWPTEANDLDVVKKTPAGRDLVGPFARAMRKEGLKVGLYYSWLDWSNPDYAALGKWRASDKEKKTRDAETMKRWKRFVEFDERQLRELCENYKPDLLWFDGDWGVSPEDWGMKAFREKLKAWDPGVVLNARMGGCGDYDTPEQGIPFDNLGKPWELCMTMGPGWGYDAGLEGKPSAQIPANYLIRLLAECTSFGGNLLLNVSPRPDGTLPEWQVERLRAIGAWLKLNAEAVYGTLPGIHRNHYAGASSLSKDRKTLYLFLFSEPVNGVMLKGLKNKPKSVSVLGASEARVRVRDVGGADWNGVPPTRFFEWPADVEIGTGRVLRIELAEPIDLYRGKSAAISQN